MAQYYYTVAALPMLFFNEKPEILLGDFIDFCETTMEPGDFRLLQRATLGNTSLPDPGEPEILTNWKRRERAVREKMAVLRAQKKNNDPSRFTRGVDYYYGAEEIAKEAFQKESPLEAETVIAEEQWSFLENQETGHIFDLNALISYYLKLQILERKRIMTHERGTEQFSRLYEILRKKPSGQESDQAGDQS